MLNHRAEAVLQAWQAENTGVLITTACSQGGSSMPEGTNKIGLCALPTYSNIAHRARGIILGEAACCVATSSCAVVQKFCSEGERN